MTALMATLAIPVVLMLVYQALRIAADVACARKGCRWGYELTNRGTEPIAMRCRRCRRWA